MEKALKPVPENSDLLYTPPPPTPPPMAPPPPLANEEKASDGEYDLAREWSSIQTESSISLHRELML